MKTLILGAGGQLGQALALAFEHHQVISMKREHLDISDPKAVHAVFTEVRPELVINAGAMTDVDGCEVDPAAAFRQNALGPRWLGQECLSFGARLVHVSTDFVFAGRPGGRYHEWDAADPVQVYGRSKLAGEYEVLSSSCRSLVVRTAWLYGGMQRGFVMSILRSAARGVPLRVVADQIGTPSFTRDVAAGIAQLVDLGATGTVHLTNLGRVSRYGLAQAIVEETGSAVPVMPITSSEIAAPAPRPTDTSLVSMVCPVFGLTLRPWREALHDFVKEVLGHGI